MTHSILVIEDTEDNRRILDDMLSASGYRIITANDGETGVEAAAAHHPDLILMDVQLPRIDGYEAARRIRANASTKDIPIIAITSYASAEDERRAVESGCIRHVSKPFSPRQVLAMVRDVLAEG